VVQRTPHEEGIMSNITTHTKLMGQCPNPNCKLGGEIKATLFVETNPLDTDIADGKMVLHGEITGVTIDHNCTVSTPRGT
jgi:hypothetical protein